MIKELGLAAILLLNSCISSPKSSFESQYGKMLYIQANGNLVGMGYDTDNDEIEDLRLIYEIVGSDNNFTYLELREKWDDKNRDGFFDNDEIEKIHSNQISDKIENII